MGSATREICDWNEKMADPAAGSATWVRHHFRRRICDSFAREHFSSFPEILIPSGPPQFSFRRRICDSNWWRTPMPLAKKTNMRLSRFLATRIGENAVCRWVRHQPKVGKLATQMKKSSHVIPEFLCGFHFPTVAHKFPSRDPCGADRDPSGIHREQSGTL